jgi:Fe-S cluster assembly iron-binding protein IscA
MKEAIRMIKLQADVSKAMGSFLDERGRKQPIRIELQSSGCCDSSLGLRVDEIRDGDLVEEHDGLTLVISNEISRMAGDITISCEEGEGRKGFVLNSTKPINEWSGFGVITIRI